MKVQKSVTQTNVKLNVCEVLLFKKNCKIIRLQKKHVDKCQIQGTGMHCVISLGHFISFLCKQQCH